MPNMHIWCPIYFGHKVVDNANCADNAFYAGALQCHLCRQCQLCAWDTVFLKLNFHPVNFHFMHIWHCLWHFLGLKYPQHICAGGLYEASGTMCYRLCQEQNSAAGDAKEAKYDFCHQISWEFIKFSTFSTLKYD